VRNLSIGVTSSIGTGLCRVPDQVFSGVPGETMQDLDYELPRIPIPRTRVNKARRRDGRGRKGAQQGILEENDRRGG
jgi:hypothetical protein